MSPFDMVCMIISLISFGVSMLFVAAVRLGQISIALVPLGLFLWLLAVVTPF